MSDILIYQNEKNLIQVEVRFEDETVWLTQAQIVSLFNSSKANISEHIKQIFKTGELDESSTVRKFRTVQKEGTREICTYLEQLTRDICQFVGKATVASFATVKNEDMRAVNHKIS